MKDICDKFIKEFENDILAAYRSRLLDNTFGDAVTYHVGSDDSHFVRLHAVVQSTDGAEEFQIVGAPDFFPIAEEDDLVSQITGAFELDEDEARARLTRAKLLR